MINKSIHYIWLGKKEMPKSYKISRESLKKFAKDFEVKVWTENELSKFDLPIYFYKLILEIMEIENELDIEIFQTLSQIKRTEEIIKFHQNQEDVSELAIFQYRRMKEDLSNQLAELLSKYSLDVKISPSIAWAA